MSHQHSRPKVDPVIAKLSEQANGSPVAELQGYVGPSEDDVVRLYGSRQMNSYVDLPTTAVLHIVEPENENKPTVIYTLASTRVRFTTVTSETLSADQVPAIVGSQGSFGRSEKGIITIESRDDRGIIIIGGGLDEKGIIIVNGRDDRVLISPKTQPQ